MSKTDHSILVDWGTSNFRAFLVDNKGNELDKTSHVMGLLQVKDKKFELALTSLLSGWRTDYRDYPVIMGGMVGSKNGWVEVPYVDTPASIHDLARYAYSTPLPWGQIATIIPGVDYFYESGNMSVMRGEEVQAIGLLNLIEKQSAIALFPGTHSKHISLDNNQIVSIDTFMTGEFFSLVTKDSILTTELPEQEESESAFLKGVKESGVYSVSQSLFFARTHRLAGTIEEKHILSYISGLLIGDELSSLSRENAVYIVASNKLTELYLLACKEKNITANAVCGDKAFIAGAVSLRGLLDV